MTTTSDARKRMAENAAARPASTPAPVAVPDADHMNAVCQVLRDYGRAIVDQMLGESDEPIHEADYAERIVSAYRPEPVVAPLPSEAVKAGIEAALLGNSEFRPDDVRAILAAALPHLRLVPEDDEGRPCLCGTPGGADCWCPVHGGALARETSLAHHVKRLNALLMKDDEDTVRERIAQAIKAAVPEQSDDAYTTGVRYGLFEALRIARTDR